MYSYQARIRYSEIDEGGNLRLETLLDYFQDCSTFQSEDLGVGISYLKERHLVWVLSSWQIVVERYPLLGENVIIGTSPYDFKGFMGYRPVRPQEDMMKKYPIEPRIEMEYASRRISVPEETIMGDTVLIKKHHLDTNHHVNNGQFIKIAMECVGSSFQVRQLRAEYKKQVHLGDVLTPYTALTEEGKHVIVLKDTTAAICCVVELEEERERS